MDAHTHKHGRRIRMGHNVQLGDDGSHHSHHHTSSNNKISLKIVLMLFRLKLATIILSDCVSIRHTHTHNLGLIIKVHTNGLTTIEGNKDIKLGEDG